MTRGDIAFFALLCAGMAVNVPFCRASMQTPNDQRDDVTPLDPLRRLVIQETYDPRNVRATGRMAP